VNEKKVAILDIISVSVKYIHVLFEEILKASIAIP